MPRVIFALFAAPALVSLAYGWGAFVAYPLGLICAILFGGPMFILCRKQGWLDWWHCVIAGTLCAAPIIILFVFSVNPGYVARTGPIVSLMLAASGAIAGLLFWWIGLFRNRRLHNPAASHPLTMLILIPIAGIVAAYGSQLVAEPMPVRIVEVTKKPEVRGEDGQAAIQLSNGETVVGELSYVFLASAKPGACFNATARRSIFLTRKLYYLGHSVSDSTCSAAKANHSVSERK